MKYIITWIVASATTTHTVQFNNRHKILEDQYGRPRDTLIVVRQEKTDTVFSAGVHRKKIFSDYAQASIFLNGLCSEGKKWNCVGSEGSLHQIWLDGERIDKYEPDVTIYHYSNLLLKPKIYSSNK